MFTEANTAVFPYTSIVLKSFYSHRYHSLVPADKNVVFLDLYQMLRIPHIILLLLNMSLHPFFLCMMVISVTVTFSVA